MISSAVSSPVMMPLPFASAELSGASGTTAPDTILAPSETVQENSSASGSKDTGGHGEKPIISLSVELVTTLQGSDDASSDVSAEPTVSEKPSKEPPPPAESGDVSVEDAEDAQIDALKARDTEVRAHEQAHAAAGGQYAGSPTYDYETGPDNQQYAIGGEVQIDTAPISGDPAATIAKMNIVRSAALAPAEPSSQDRSVAAAAAKQIGEAQAELAAQRSESSSPTEEVEGTASENNAPESSATGPYQPSGTGPERPESTSNIINIIS
ncbi:MAG: putative metalloprotease CJM1_0395 family protein [Sneathiella sp.]